MTIADLIEKGEQQIYTEFEFIDDDLLENVLEKNGKLKKQVMNGGSFDPFEQTVVINRNLSQKD